jgi:hypothetical protein
LFLAQIITQEFAKTPIISPQGEIHFRSFLRKNQKMLALFFVFLLTSFLRKNNFISSLNLNAEKA